MKLTPKIQQAINFVAEKHLGQTRRGIPFPYVVHPFSVAIVLSGYTEDEDIIVAGLLHDVLEDVPGCKYGDLVKNFGFRAAHIVMEVTEDNDPDEISDKRATWLARKNQYLYNLEHDSRDALMVTAADKIHNLRSMIDGYHKIGEELWGRFNAPKEQKLWYYKQVLHILEKRLPNGIVKELKYVYWEAEHLFNNSPNAA
jgi:(p)ppGpp synthase/HD superfamily hydrolase